MVRTKLSLIVTGLTLGAALAFAEPEFSLRYPNGIPQVSIAGDYAGSHYTVWRVDPAGGEPVVIGERAILCMGSCFAEDRTARPGASYLYLFEVAGAGGVPGALARFGPYPATISPAIGRPVGVFVYPNPGRGATSVQLHLAGHPGDAPVAARAAFYDLSGRRVRTVHDGPLARGLTTVSWDGRGEDGRVLPAGLYLLRLSAGREVATALVVRR